MTDESFPGSCLCGAVRFVLRPPTKWCANCHCSRCRSAHGAPFVTFVGVQSEQLQILSGEEHVSRYTHHLQGPEGSEGSSERSFCSTCGSPLFFRASRWPNEVHVARAAIPGDIDRLPQAHCFFDDRAPWVEIADRLPRRGGKTGVEPLSSPT